MSSLARFLACLLILTVIARAELLDPGGDKRLLITSDDRLVELDPSSGAHRQLLHLPGLKDGSLKQLSKERWLLVGEGGLTALSPAGQVLWRSELDGKLVWGPEAVGEAGLAMVVQAPDKSCQLTVLDLVSGKASLQAGLPGRPGQVFPSDGNWLLVIAPPEPAPFNPGYRRQEPPPVPEPGPEQLVLVDGKTGQVIWSLVPEGKLEGGPWLLGDRVLEVEQGGAQSPYFLVSIEPVPHILKGLKRAWNYPLQELPNYQWDLPLQGRLVGPPLEAGDRLVAVERSTGDRILMLEQEQGNLAWDLALEGEVLPDAEGTPLLLLRDNDLVVFQKQSAGTRVRWLNRQTGTVENELELTGEPLHAFQQGDRLFVFLKSSAPEPRLDSAGQPVINPKTRQPEQTVVESFRLVELGETEQTVMDAPRSSLLGTPVLEEGRLTFASRLTPAQAAGQSRAIDVKYPQEPILLHAVDLQQGKELWSYRPARPDDRIAEEWGFLDPQRIWFSTPDRRVVLLDASTGKVVATSAQLPEMVTSLTRVQDHLVATLGSDRYLGLRSDATTAWPEQSFVPFFDMSKLNNLIGVAVLVVFLAYFIYAARKKELFIRRIAGLNALDEAVGRATEMGKPVLYVHGLADVDDIQILASLSILGHVAKKTAEYDTPILVPCSRSVVMSTAQEVVKESYTAAGRPDAFQRDNINYLTDEQFGYVAGVDGIMMREKPAANFYLGTFYAESLILAETGHSTGAIQIAGTAMPSQLPFFVSACDYTLIGEELYAASAYLSRDPMQVGSLRGQDVGKALLMICIFLGALLVTFGHPVIKEWFK